jgi:hypothetical protein
MARIEGRKIDWPALKSYPRDRPQLFVSLSRSHFDRPGLLLRTVIVEDHLF